ncbi:MAG: M28 family peptidase [Bacteroidia bacterium]|nr:M28 family peptidase [Rikenellaceae bacterium]NCB18298.1 M28 family peptidase [Bacteroidia bacterium]
MFLPICAAIVLLMSAAPARANISDGQNARYVAIPDTQKIKSTLSFVSDDLTKGRLTGTPGNMIVSSFLRDKLSSLGMIPFYSSTFTQSFPVQGGETIGRNVVGVLPSIYYSPKYIIISAHYDHLGILGGRIYNGADDNASGVTALLTIAEWFSNMRQQREGPRINIVFALFDAKESSLAGSEYFAKHLKVPVSDIIMNINLDQLGCTFAPPGNNENYILYVADKRIRSDIKRKLNINNGFYNLGMDIDHTFYGSNAFYEIFFKTSDQFNLSQKGIPSIMFTSGIHMHTYKPTDEHYFINYPVFINRIKLIYHLIEDFAK